MSRLRLRLESSRLGWGHGLWVLIAVSTLVAAGSAIAILPSARSAHATSGEEPIVALGKRIYREGILLSGRPLHATVQRDVDVGGAQLVCENCHGRSGLGQGEGKIFTPPITADSLYEPRVIHHSKLEGSRTLRPAYSEETLARAIRVGLDSNGRVLDAMMPRYALDDEDLRALAAYLKTLSSSYSPGVTDTHIHFATVISEDVTPVERGAMLGVLEKYFENKNAETRLEARRAVNAPAYKAWHYRAYRKWVLHVWELRGPQSSWRHQLDAFYEQQPVFALMSGIVADSWQPVHEFCEKGEIPCLFPNTDLPVVSESGYYSLYFSRGMTLEAEALAKHLHEIAPAQRVVQVFRDRGRGSAAAAAFRRAVKGYGSADLHDRRLTGSGPIRTDFWRELEREDGPAWLVLWLSKDDIAGLEGGLTGQAAPDRRIYFSSSLVGDHSWSAAEGLRASAYTLHRFDLPEDTVRRSRGLDAWLRSNGIEASDKRLQMNALYTATVTAQALKHIGGNFFRDYFLERVEHIVDSMVVPSAYPRLTLAPGQRFASKGCYIVRLAQGPESASPADSLWIVP